MKHISKIGKSMTAVVSLTLSAGAFATEGGGSSFLNGVEQFMVTTTPPPGVYYMLQAAQYDADELRDNNGDVRPFPAHKQIQALASRFVWSTDAKILGGRLVFQGVVPLLKVEGQIGPSKQTNTGLGDITLGSGLAYSPSLETNYSFGFTVTAPTGEYDVKNLANPGRNYWSVRPRFAVSHAEVDGLNADLVVSYDFNRTNKDTHYKSGQEFHADYALGWGFATDWTAGVSGFVYQQTTDDELKGLTVKDKRGRALGFGPALKYDNGYGLVITAAYQKEFEVKNRFSGDTFSVRLALPF